jgi:phosphoribosyl 1,2-cyclic phosphate phosphodiesterase
MKGFGYIFKEYEGSGYTPIMHPSEISGPFELFGLSIVPVALEHGRTSALGYRIGNFAYLTDCSRIPETSLPLLEGLDTLVMDGLRWTPHPFHFNIEGATEVARQIGVRRTILTHLSHEVAYTEGARLPKGIEFAYDGMEFDLPEN